MKNSTLEVDSFRTFHAIFPVLNPLFSLLNIFSSRAGVYATRREDPVSFHSAQPAIFPFHSNDQCEEALSFRNSRQTRRHSFP
jgi:hypothetical protein